MVFSKITKFFLVLVLISLTTFPKEIYSETEPKLATDKQNVLKEKAKGEKIEGLLN